MSLSDLAEEIRACRLCETQEPPLPHQARPVLRVSRSARLCIAGQAPGTRVHASGTPFDDPSGDRLRAWMGVDRDTFYDETRIAIVPMGFCFPGLDAKGGDLPPRKECAPTWRARLMAEMPQIELFLLIGQYAQKWHLEKSRGKTLTETVRNWRDHQPLFLPLPHPSWRNNVWLKKNLWFESEVVPHLREEVLRLTQPHGRATSRREV